MELLGHCLKERRDIETGQARSEERGGGGLSVCLCAGVGQAFVFVTGAAFGR